MVWEEAAKAETKNRVVPLAECKPEHLDLVLLPTPALSSPLLKTCWDSRAAFLLLVPTALEVVGCHRESGCTCTRPSGTVYINPASDIAVWFQVPRTPPWSRPEKWLPGICGHRRAMRVDDVCNTFRRLIAMSWDWDDDDISPTYKQPFNVPRSEVMLRMSIPYRLSSAEDIRENTYEQLLCNGVDPEAAERRCIEETVIDEHYVPDLTLEYENVHLRDLRCCLKYMSGPGFLMLYRHCFYKNTRGDLPKKGDIFGIEETKDGSPKQRKMSHSEEEESSESDEEESFESDEGGSSENKK